MSKAYDFSNYQKDTLTRPRDVAWDNWHSWKEAKIGDKIQGFIADAFYRPEEKDSRGNVAFREQRGITLKLVDGTLVNVGIKFIDFVLKSTDNLRIGDPLTIELTKIQAPKEKGQNGAKVFAFFGTNLPDNVNNKTVKQLTDEDRLVGGSVAPEPETPEPSAEDKSFDALAGAEADPLA